MHRKTHLLVKDANHDHDVPSRLLDGIQIPDGVHGLEPAIATHARTYAASAGVTGRRAQLGQARIAPLLHELLVAAIAVPLGRGAPALAAPSLLLLLLASAERPHASCSCSCSSTARAVDAGLALLSRVPCSFVRARVSHDALGSRVGVVDRVVHRGVDAAAVAVRHAGMGLWW